MLESSNYCNPYCIQAVDYYLYTHGLFFGSLINRSLTGFLSISRGLWQGDRLSPLLVLLMMEVLSWVLCFELSFQGNNLSCLIQATVVIHIAYISEVNITNFQNILTLKFTFITQAVDLYLYIHGLFFGSLINGFTIGFFQQFEGIEARGSPIPIACPFDDGNFELDVGENGGGQSNHMFQGQ